MLLIICLTQLIMLIISFVVNKRALFKWIFIVNLWWIVLILANYINPYGGYEISYETYFLIWLFLLFLTAGYTFPQFTNLNADAYEENNIISQYDNSILHNGVIRIAMYIITILLCVFAVRYANYIGLENVNDSRIARFYVGSVFHSTLELLFFNYIISAGRFFFIFIISFGILYGKIKNRIFVLSVIDLFLYSYIGGSRFPLVLLAVELIVLLLLKRQYSKYKLSMKKVWKGVLIIFVAFVVVFCMLYFTAYRLGMIKYSSDFMRESWKVLYDQIVGYNIGPLAGLSKSLDSGILYNHYFWGRAAILNGVDEFASNIFSILGLNIESARYVVGGITAQAINIGSKSFNALFTCIYWFYSDMGILGVIVYSFFFGMIEKKVLCNFIHNPTLWSLMLVTHMMYFFIMSNFTWDINGPDSLVYIALLYVYFRKFRHTSTSYMQLIQVRSFLYTLKSKRN